MMPEKFDIRVDSEIGALEGVILHAPGKEIENMTPRNVERALYSDILNLSVAGREYNQVIGVLEKRSRVFYIKELLASLLDNAKVKETLVLNICKNEHVDDLADELLDLPNQELATQLLEGVVMKKDTLTRFLNKEYYSLPPLHNFFYTRDAAIAMNNWVLVGKMAGQVRERETLIMEAIFASHPRFSTRTVAPSYTGPENVIIEGGDILAAREDILLAGIGARTTPQGVDFLISELNKRKISKHIIVQELPTHPESFIHLDMVFTFLDIDKCMVYEPVILLPNRFQTVHITLENGRVCGIKEEKNIPDALKKLGMDLEPVMCGGSGDSWIQEREQWHSGANFFAIAPGHVMGYGRNVHTLEEMDKHGFEVLTAQQVIDNQVDPSSYKRCVITLDGAELPRGGGCRCMTMPLRRSPL